MIKQTITWTALPKGSNGPKQAGTELRLSVFVATRLWNDDPSVTTMPLGDFPDWLDWPAMVAQSSWQVEFQGGPTLAATPENVNLRSDLWQALFKSTTTVKPFVFEDRSGLTIHSFAAATIHDSIKKIYQKAAIDPSWGGGTDLPDRGVLAADPDLIDIARPVEPLPPWEPPETDRGPVFVGDEEPPDEEDGEIDGEPEAGEGGCLGCLLLPARLLGKLLERLGLKLFALPMALEPAPESRDERAEPPPPDGAMGDGSGKRASRAAARSAASQQQAFNDLHAYAQPLSEVEHPLPTAAEVHDQYDFHQMVAALGDYPNLLRYLGLVVDLVVTLDPTLPADNGTVKAVATLPLTTPTTHANPRTHYSVGNERFLTRARAGSDLSDGLLRLDDSTRFRVVMTDVSGGGLKVQNTATNMRGMHLLASWPANAPDDAGLPALQTAGISIVRAEQVAELVRRFDHSYALNSFLAAAELRGAPAYLGSGTPPDPSDELFADDLVRGYRVDLFDDKAAAWHSVCRRVGSYEFEEGTGGPISLAGEEDEGFVQLCSTESLDESDDDLNVHESLFTWDGWSLAAPRPGLTLMDDENPAVVPNDPQTQFKLSTGFTAKPGSLPRLRFGWCYRVRARVVDLAGNSVFGPEDAEFGNTQAQATAEFQFSRYEPVSPPQLALRALPVEGESLENAVVRSTIHDDAATVAAQQVERHVVPPKTSQLMVERHGIFDDSPGMRKDAAAYDLASREAGSLTERMNFTTGTLELIPGTAKHEISPGRVYWLQPNEQFEVGFLPDPFARGVLFMGLPGVAPPDAVTDGVNRIAFTGAWPDLQPLRLRLKGLKDGAGPPAAPVWNAADRMLTVEVPQGETIDVRYSSYFEPADRDMMGVWEWVKEAGPANLAALEQLAADGRSWLHLPFRTLTLVHAVQQPLEIPVIPGPDGLKISPDKKLGATSATLEGRVEIDAKSTGKIDLEASWVDPFDDLGKPAYNPATDVLSREMQVAEVVAHDAANDQLGINGIEHALGDTKYHKVTYAATGTTRYREYFPAATPRDDLIRPTPAESGTQPAEDAKFELDIPNSARPDAVKPLYAVPVVSWSESEAAGIITRVRQGGGLRLYMERPWFSSGAGELLGAVLRPAKYAALGEEWRTLRKFVSEWGMDPIWRATETAPLAAGDFANAVDSKGGLSLAELSGLDVGVVGFTPEYDPDRNLWFCDIALAADHHYFPFVRLALVRYQPISVPDAHLSRVVPSDFLQVLPHRRVDYNLNRIAADGLIPIRVRGPAYLHRELEQLGSPLVMARLERRRFDTGDELGWETVASQALPATKKDPRETVWEGELRLPAQAPSPMRVVVLEAEMYEADPAERTELTALLAGGQVGISDQPTASSVGGDRQRGFRIAFADSIELP